MAYVACILFLLDIICDLKEPRFRDLKWFPQGHTAKKMADLGFEAKPGKKLSTSGDPAATV